MIGRRRLLPHAAMVSVVLLTSIRHAARQFWVSLAFTAGVVFTLALGSGGTTAIFTLIDAVMLR